MGQSPCRTTAIVLINNGVATEIIKRIHAMVEQCRTDSALNESSESSLGLDYPAESMRKFLDGGAVTDKI